MSELLVVLSRGSGTSSLLPSELSMKRPEKCACCPPRSADGVELVLGQVLAQMPGELRARVAQIRLRGRPRRVRLSGGNARAVKARGQKPESSQTKAPQSPAYLVPEGYPAQPRRSPPGLQLSISKGAAQLPSTYKTHVYEPPLCKTATIHNRPSVRALYVLRV